MAWRVEVLNRDVEQELLALPADIQARYLRVVELLEAFGPHQVGMPHVRPLENKLWEMRMRGRDGIGRAIYAGQGAGTMSKRSLKERMLENEAVRGHYDALEPEYALARDLIAARTRAGLTQAEVAERMGTTQSAVARMESGKRMPSLQTLRRYAEATGARAEVHIVPLDRSAAS